MTMREIKLVQIASPTSSSPVTVPLGASGEQPTVLLGTFDPDSAALADRVTRLETELKHLQGVFNNLRPMLERIDERLDHVPSAKDVGDRIDDRLKSFPSSADFRSQGERVSHVDGQLRNVVTTNHLVGWLLFFATAIVGIMLGMLKYVGLV